MILAAYGDDLYKVLLLGHIISLLVAFAPAVINPILMTQLKNDGDPATLGKVAAHVGANGRRIHLPALVAVGGFGIAMVLTSDDVWSFGDTWVSLAFLVWLAIAGIVTGVLLPAERKLAGGDQSAETTVERAGQVTTLLLLVMLYLMIWKP